MCVCECVVYSANRFKLYFNIVKIQNRIHNFEQKLWINFTKIKPKSGKPKESGNWPLNWWLWKSNSNLSELLQWYFNVILKWSGVSGVSGEKEKARYNQVYIYIYIFFHNSKYLQQHKK